MFTRLISQIVGIGYWLILPILGLDLNLTEYIALVTFASSVVYFLPLPSTKYVLANDNTALPLISLVLSMLLFVVSEAAALTLLLVYERSCFGILRKLESLNRYYFFVIVGRLMALCLLHNGITSIYFLEFIPRLFLIYALIVGFKPPTIVFEWKLLGSGWLYNVLVLGIPLLMASRVDNYNGILLTRMVFALVASLNALTLLKPSSFERTIWFAGVIIISLIFLPAFWYFDIPTEFLSLYMLLPVLLSEKAFFWYLHDSPSDVEFKVSLIFALCLNFALFYPIHVVICLAWLSVTMYLSVQRNKVKYDTN